MLSIKTYETDIPSLFCLSFSFRVILWVSCSAGQRFDGTGEPLNANYVHVKWKSNDRSFDLFYPLLRCALAVVDQERWRYEEENQVI